MKNPPSPLKSFNSYINSIFKLGFKMNHTDSDLEEGEIPDDSPSSPCINNKKNRELPRRYIVQENKSTRFHKHKRDCKHSVRYRAKKLPKLKKTPAKGKDTYKKHKSTCPHDKTYKPFNKCDSNVEKQHLSKNGYSFPKQSLIAEMKGSFIEKQITGQKSKRERNLSEAEVIQISDDSSISEKDIKDTDFNPKNNMSLSDSKQHDQHSIKDTDDLPHFNEIDNIKLTQISNNSSESKNEESEDEEELRRIALATFAKRKANVEPSENLIQSVDNSYSVSLPDSLDINNVSIFCNETSNPASDNYEVVDMEVDDDTETSIEIIQTPEEDQDANFLENLYVIDNKPSGNITENALQKLHTVTNSSDDEFEADMLRAELIDSMYRKQNLEEELIEAPKEKSVSIDLKPVNNKPVIPKKKCINNYQKSNFNLRCKQLRTVKHIVRKNIVNKCENLQCAKKTVAPIQVPKSSERLIIALNEESSSEDSEDSDKNSVPENPVASIEALISDCRQKSESSENIQEDVKHVPKAVSCLSKAQQEEYNSLMKILAEKKKLPAPPETFPHKNGSAHSPLADLKILDGKLIGLKETLQKKRNLMEVLSKEINSKKFSYMKSKLSAQHLKEQYLAADKVRKATLCAWSKSCSEFKNVKKSVSDLENKIIELQNLSSKVNASIQGQTYISTSLPTGNKQS